MSQFIVRAMPAPGKDHRFRCGRAWGKDPITITVSDNPAPPRVSKDRDGNVLVTPSLEFDPKQLEQMRADPHLSIVPAGEADGTSLAVNSAKAEVLKLQAELETARRDMAALTEEHKAFRSAVMKDAEEQATKVRELEKQLADAQAVITQKEPVVFATPPPSKKGNKE